MAEITEKYHLAGGQPHYLQEISFADFKPGCFESDVPGVEKRAREDG